MSELSTTPSLPVSTTDQSTKTSDISVVSPNPLSRLMNPGKFQDEVIIQTWLSGKAKNSKRAYVRIIREFQKCIDPAGLRDFDLMTLQAFCEKRVGESKSSHSLRCATVKSILSHASKSGYAKHNLGVFLPKLKTDSKITDRYLSEDEVKRMRSACQKTIEGLVLDLLYFGGLRVSELIQMNKEDLHFQSDGSLFVKIQGKGDKQRVIKFGSGVGQQLKDFIQGEKSGPVFTSKHKDVNRLTDRTVRDMIFRLAMRAGVLKKVSPHWLRHAHASHALDRGAPISLVQSTLGHASVATTGNYLHARPGESSGDYLG